MANNYIPGFTPSLHGQPVKRMALGGRMESGRWFNEGRDRDTGDMPYTAEVASAAPAVAQSIASSPVAAPTAAAYQQPTPEPAQANYGFDPYDLSGFDMYGLGEYASQFYQQPTPQTAATNYQSLPTPQPVQTAPYVDYATPTNYQSLPTPQPVQTAPYYEDYNFDPYGIGNFDLSSYQSQPTAAQLAARDLELTKPGVSNARWDPFANAFMYDMAPTKVTEPTGPYTSDAAPALQPEDPSPYPALTVASPHIGPAVAYRNSVIDPTYAPETKSYLQQLNDYIQAQSKTLGADISSRYYSVVPTMVYEPREVPRGRFDGELGMSAFDEKNFVPAEESALQQYLGKPLEENIAYSTHLFNNSGDQAGTLNVRYNTPVVLVDDATGKVVYSGTGFAAAQEAAKKAQELSSSLGKKAEWSVYTGPAGSTDLSQFTRAAQETKNKGVLGTVADIALPVLGSILLPGVGGIAGALGSVGSAAAGSALGSALSGTLQGRDFGDILKGAALSGGLTYAGGSLLGDALGSSVNSSAFDAAFSPEYASWLASGANTAAPAIAGGSLAGLGGSFAGTDALGNFIQVAGGAGSNIPTSVLNAALGAALAAPGLVNYGNQVWGDQPSSQGGEANQSYIDPVTGDIVVPAGSTNFPIDPNSILSGFLGSQFGNLVNPDYSGLGDLANQYEIQEPQEDIPEGADEGWTVEAPKENVIIPPSAAIPELFPPINSVDIPTDLVKEWPEVPADEIVVEGVPPRAPDLLPPIVPPLNSVNIPPADTLFPPENQPPTTNQPPKVDIKDILDILKTIGIGAGAAAAGGGGGLSGARGPLNPIFSAQLPPPNMQAAIARPMSGIDWYRYGYGPEQSFFTNVPQGAANTSTAYTGYEGGLAALIEKMKKAGLLPGYADGGYAVGGPGDGREDKIPAMLSDGEYVIDAETVAMLGNGSSKAGADALDKFRVNIRKHKGRKLSKGEFSVDAKKPEQYLKGHK